MARLSLPDNQRVGALADSQITALSSILSTPTPEDAKDPILSNLLIEQDLKRKVHSDIKHLIEINCYRGQRHRAGLPVRGQRTKVNAKTAKKLNARRAEGSL